LKIPSFWKIDFQNKIVRQTISLYSSELIALFLGICTGVLNTRALGPDGYGILAFFGVVTSFTVLFFRFGIFSAAGVLLAQCKHEMQARELIGASVFLGFVIGIFYSIFIFILSFFIDGWFNVEIGWILRWASLMLVALPMTLLVPQIGRGINAIFSISAFNIIRPLLYLGGSLMILLSVTIEPVHLILLSCASTVIALFFIIHAFHPHFSHLHENIHTIFKKTKEYGFHLYLGQIADQSTQQLNGLLIPLFVNTTQLGFFSLALMITSPIAGMSRSLATSLFRDFAHASKIPKKVIYYNMVWLGSCVIGLNIFGSYIIDLLFSKNFYPASQLILPLSIAIFFQGMCQPYNVFLGAQMYGKELRNISIIVSFIFLIFNLILIPIFDVFGAALALILGYLISFIFQFYYYSKNCVL
jgi:O-antigen/teichoic acid export membrane protein